MPKLKSGSAKPRAMPIRKNNATFSQKKGRLPPHATYAGGAKPKSLR